jgi:predicted nucleic acid-binding Zn ribbon protein
MLSKGRARRSSSATGKKQPLALNAALHDFAASVGIARKLREYSVVTSWEAIVGEQIAMVDKPQRVDKGILYVAVASAPWRAELNMRRREMIEKINVAVGKKVVQEIRFR